MGLKYEQWNDGIIDQKRSLLVDGIEKEIERYFQKGRK